MNKQRPLKVSDIETCRYYWSKKQWISNIIVSLIIGFALVSSSIACVNEKEAVIVPVIFGMVIIGIISGSPVGLVVDDDYIALKRLLGRQLIDKSDIVRIQEVDQAFFRACRRHSGSNAFGYWGIWHHPQEGKLRVFCTNSDRLALIETSDKKYLINY